MESIKKEKSKKENVNNGDYSMVLVALLFILAVVIMSIGSLSLGRKHKEKEIVKSEEMTQEGLRSLERVSISFQYEK